MSARVVFLVIVAGVLVAVLGVRVADDLHRYRALSSGAYRIHHFESQPDSIRWQVSGNGVVAAGSTLDEAIDGVRR